MTPDAQPPPLKLTRHFSLVSLVGVLVVALALLLFYRQHTTQHLAEQGGVANADITRLLANTLWPRFRSFVVQPGSRSREELLADPSLAELHAKVQQAMRGLHLVKLKIYNRDGITVFSTDPAQIGENKRDNLGFQRALGGQVVSEITHRDRFDTLEGVIVDRDLIASYVPISRAGTDTPEAVVEVYADITSLLQQEAAELRLGAGIVLALLGTLYLFLLATVRRADGVMAAHALERAEQAAQVRHLAYHDGLTGLPNRRSFNERLARALAEAGLQRQQAALLFIDLDRFKAVNDGLGHAAGDELLQAVARRIQGCLREGDGLYRMGGDEFIALLPCLAQADEAAAVAQRIRQAVAAPVVLMGTEVAVGASIGLAHYPADGADAEVLLRRADHAMYEVKAHARASGPLSAGPVPAPGLSRSVAAA